jgi:hypothetical protein
MSYIPRFGLPIAKEKIKVAPEPPELATMFESYTAMVPMDLAKIEQKLDESVGTLKEKTYTKHTEKPIDFMDGTIIFKDLSKRLPTEVRSKILNTQKGLGKFMLEAQNRLRSTRLDIVFKEPQIELMKSLEPQSDDLLLSRAKTLENKKVDIEKSLDVLGKYIVLKTGTIEGFGQTLAPVAFFKSGSPNLQKLKPFLLNQSIEPKPVVPKTVGPISPVSIKHTESSEPVGSAVGIEGEKPAELTKSSEPAIIKESTPEFAAISQQVTKVLHKDLVEIKLPAKNPEGKPIEAYVPYNRAGFPYFMWYVYNKYRLAELPKDFDPDYCKKIKGSEEGALALQAYQKMVRDYLQKSSPYRGLLVNHGLGSGKSCASIAAMESIFAPGNKPIFVFTPASLEPNYVGELMTCGPFVFRLKNYWYFQPIEDVTRPTPELAFLLDIMKMNRSMIKKLNGAWIPVPSKPSNFDSLSSAQQQAIRTQIEDHIHYRIEFHHYNSSTFATKLFDWACNTPTIFDGATIVIDEVHNLIRNINNSYVENEYEKKKEPTTMAQYKPTFCKVRAEYRGSYLFYRMIRNAVGCKIVALSATPLINFPQELGILANVLAGDIRMVNVDANNFPNREQLLNELKQHPEVDFAEVVPKESGGVLRFSPIPSGFRKVLSDSGQLKGYVKIDGISTAATEINRERDLDSFYNRVVEYLVSKFPTIKLGISKFESVSRLPDIDERFNEYFIDQDSLEVKEENKLILTARLSGLISYYKGERPETMPKVSSDNIVELDMSDLQLGYYAGIREEEIKKERKPKKVFDPSTSVLKEISGTFKVFSRMACDFAFPEDIQRPRPKKLSDLIEKQIESDDSDKETKEEVETDTKVDLESDVETESTAITKLTSIPYPEQIELALEHFKKTPELYFGTDTLKLYSPKYQAILDNISKSPGPVLVYSNFYRLEGVRLFLAAIAYQQKYVELDVESDGKGSWTLSEKTINAGKVPRYMTYTGAVSKEKRDILKNIFNGKWEKLPAELVSQVKELTGQDHNRDGNICKIFVITQAGAEGISLSNVRQVHIMEPYWNKVRTEQVKGRAIRTCSHEDLPLDQRNVDIYTYIMKFSKDQILKRKVNETLLNIDEGLTTDQIILQIAMSKEKLNNSLLNVMKSSAIDCELFKKENGFNQSCYRIGKNESDMEYTFHPYLETDVREKKVRIKA